MPGKKRIGLTPAHALISQRSHDTTGEVDGPAAPKSTPSAPRAAFLVSSGNGDPWGGVRILRGRPVPMSSSQVASTTSSPMPSRGSATMVFMAIPGALLINSGHKHGDVRAAGLNSSPTHSLAKTSYGRVRDRGRRTAARTPGARGIRSGRLLPAGGR